MRPWHLGTCALAGMLAVQAPTPAFAQQAVRQPQTFITWNNRTAAEQTGPALAYAGDADAYVPARLLRGVPSNLMSYVVTQGNAGPDEILASVAFRRAAGAAPAQFLFPTTPAGQANTSLGGLVASFAWGAADVVMNQCYAGGFAFNIAGSLQGATSVAGAAVAPAHRIAYTFASAANYNELAYGRAEPSGAAGPATMTAMADFTQGQAYASTTTATPAFGLLRAWRNGRLADPFVVGGLPYGMANQVPTVPGPPPRANLQAGGFESPVFGSSDALTAAGAPDPAGASNVRTYATNAAHRWAVLVGFTPDRSEFSLDIQRQYAALIASGVPRSHIIVLYGDGTAGTLKRFTALAAGNDLPRVNTILDTVAAGFEVPVHGAASGANLAGLLDAAALQNPGAPPADRRSFWQSLAGNGAAGARPAAGDSLLLYTTGHGSAVNVFGAELTAANRAVGGVFQTDFKITGPGNLEIVPGTLVNAQITVRGTPFGLGSSELSVNGFALGTGTLAAVAAGTPLDMSPFVADGGLGLHYLDLRIPAEAFLAMGGRGASVFDLWVQNANGVAAEEFQQAFAAFTLVNGDLGTCALGSCDLYTSLAGAVPEPAAWLLLAAGWGLLAALRHRRAGRASRNAG